jgi:hypothetical protein
MSPRRIALSLILSALPLLTAAADQGFRILALEKIGSAAGLAGRSPSFDANGRRFDFELAPNERLRALQKSAGAGVEAMRGTVAGSAGSWVRLTRTPVGLYGMLWDGRDLYAIEPAHEAARHAVAPVETEAGETVIYRLADTIVPPGAMACGVTMAGRATSALDVYEAVGKELKAAAAAQLVPTKQLSLALVGDFEFATFAFGGGLTPEAAATARMNIVDGIFSSQVGVRIDVGLTTMFRDANDPFTATSSTTALDELADWRSRTPAQTARGLTHLMTGKDLDGNTVGIAFVGALCRTRSSSGLSQGTLMTSLAALVAAHEIGHNFGAPHDGQSDGACAATPPNFLMAPQLNNVDQFSDCSLAQMAPIVAAASCLTPLAASDAAISVPAGSVRRLRGERFDYIFEVQSVGTVAVDGVTATAQLPQSFTVNGSAASDGATCGLGANNTVTCPLGSIPAGAVRTITLNLTGNIVGTGTATFSLTATNDQSAANNSRQVSFVTDASADLRVTLSASPGSIALNASTQATATIANDGNSPVTDARLSFSVPSGLTVSAVGSNALGCALQGGAVTCAATALAANASQSVTLTIAGAQGGAQSLGASVSASLGDPVTTNNSATVTIDVQSPASSAAPGSSSGGGGGGRVPLALLAALALLLCLRGKLGTLPHFPALIAAWVPGALRGKMRQCP